MSTANGGLLLRRIKPSGISASSHKTGYEIEKAFDDPNPSIIYNSDAQTANINMTFDDILPLPHAFTLVNHNLPATAVVQLKYYSNSGFTTLIGTITMTRNEKNMYRIIDTGDLPSINKYVQLSIDSKQTDFYIGVIFCSNVFQFPHNYSWGYEVEFTVEKEVETTDEGYNIEFPGDDDDWNAAEYSKIKITFDDIDRTYYPTFLQVIRPGKKVFFESKNRQTCYYGIVPDKKLTAKKNKTGDTYPITFIEDAIGESQ